MQDANQRMRDYLANVTNAAYVDAGSMILGSEGLQPTELFQKDGVHLSEGGYVCWARLIAPLLN